MNSYAEGEYLTLLPCNPDNAAHVAIQSVTGTGQNEQSKPSGYAVKPSSENVSNWESTAYSTIKLAMNLVKESADVFPPLKSVVGGLSAILDHCDVRIIDYPLHNPTHGAHASPRKRCRAAKQ